MVAESYFQPQASSKGILA